MVSIISTVRDIERLRQIVLVLGKHGFGEIVRRAGLGGESSERGQLPAGAAEGEAPRGISLGERVRLVLQDLGPSFVKLGQILSTRPDVVPPEIIAELKKLQDRVPPVPFAELRPEVEGELGAPLETLFESLDETPLASASIAQVHRARYRLADSAEGEDRIVEVVLKIQRPKIQATIARDLELLHLIARTIERTIPESRMYNPVGLAEEFDRAISAELDFSLEADNAERFARNAAGREDVVFPRVFRAASAKRVLTLEYLPGLKVHDALACGHTGEQISKIVLSALFEQIFDQGFFHADPHPGNMLILGTPSAPRVAFIDLGLVGRLSPELRDKTVDLMVAAARQDARGVALALYAIGIPTRRVDRAKYEAEATFLAERYLGKPLVEIEVASMVRDLVYGAIKYGLEIPPDFLMLGRTLMTVEGVGKEIYPQLDVFTETRPYFLRLLWRRYSPERLGTGILKMASSLSGTATGLPMKLDEVLDELRRGTLAIRVTDDEATHASDLLGRRIFSGLVVAALVLGSSLAWERRPSMGLALLIAAIVWALGHVLRCGRGSASGARGGNGAAGRS